MLQARRRQKKLPIPDTLKLTRGPKRRKFSEPVLLSPSSDHLQIIPWVRESEEVVIVENAVKEGRMKKGGGRKAEGQKKINSLNKAVSMMESLENAYSSLEVTLPSSVEDSENFKMDGRVNDTDFYAVHAPGNITISNSDRVFSLDASNSTDITDMENSCDVDASRKKTWRGIENSNVRTKKRKASQEVELPVERARLIKKRRNFRFNAPLPPEDRTADQKNPTLGALYVEGTTINQKSIVLAPMPVRKKTINRKIVDSAVRSTLDVPPDEIRCRRNDGKQWRCKRQALENYCFCELHQVQQYRRQYKLGVPDELKLQRKPRGGLVVHPQIQKLKSAQERIQRIKDKGLNKKKKDYKKKRNNKIESLAVELMVSIMKKKMEKSEKDEERRREEGSVDIVKSLPNGVMRISNGCSNNSTQQLKIKLGVDQSSFFHRCFRSKNVEPPVGTIQVSYPVIHVFLVVLSDLADELLFIMFFSSSILSVKKAPYVRKALGLVNRRKKTCHHCRSSNRSCLKKW